MVSSDYAKLYQAVGENTLWQDRSDWDRTTILQHLQQPELLFFAARAEGRYVGVLELAKTSDTEAEVRHCVMLEEAADLLGPFVQHMLRHAWNHWDLERVTLRLLSRETPAVLQVFHLNGFSRRRSLLLLEKPLEHLISHLRAST
jgi:hypothetical protein